MKATSLLITEQLKLNRVETNVRKALNDALIT